MMCVQIIGVSLTVNAGLVDGVIDSLSVSGQTSVMPATKPAEVYQGLLQLQAWVSANGVLKDCMIKVYL